MIRCNAATTTRDVISDVTRLPVAPRVRLSSQISDWRNVEEKPVQKEQRDPQAHLVGRIDFGENAAAPLVDDNDFSDRDFSQREWSVRNSITRHQSSRAVRAACRTQTGQLEL